MTDCYDSRPKQGTVRMKRTNGGRKNVIRTRASGINNNDKYNYYYHCSNLRQQQQEPLRQIDGHTEQMKGALREPTAEMKNRSLIIRQISSRRICRRTLVPFSSLTGPVSVRTKTSSCWWKRYICCLINPVAFLCIYVTQSARDEMSELQSNFSLAVRANGSFKMEGTVAVHQNFNQSPLYVMRALTNFQTNLCRCFRISRRG